MEYVGLLLELAFLALGVYLYLYSRGMLPGFDTRTEKGKRAEAFRIKNAWWLRLAGLALIAISAVNLYLHISQLLGSS